MFETYQVIDIELVVTFHPVEEAPRAMTLVNVRSRWDLAAVLAFCVEEHFVPASIVGANPLDYRVSWNGVSQTIRAVKGTAVGKFAHDERGRLGDPDRRVFHVDVLPSPLMMAEVVD